MSILDFIVEFAEAAEEAKERQKKSHATKPPHSKRRR